MDSNNENIDDARSKIEKIRIDLEKKLAALEAAKIKTTQKGISGGDIIEEVVINETISEKENVDDNPIEEISINKESEIDNSAEVETIKDESIVEEESIIEVNKVEENKNFIEQISSIEDSSILDNTNKVDNNIVEDVKVNDKNVSVEAERLSDNNIKPDIVEDNTSNNDTFFEINDVIEEVDDEVVTVKDNIAEEEGNDKKIIAVSNETKQPVKTDTVAVVPGIKKTVAKKEVVIKETKKEKEEKKSKLGFLIYALGAITIFVLGYLTWNYMKNNQSGNDDSDRLMSEYKNRIYRDSIELADTNNQFLDFQKRYIDSIALANEIEIEIKSGSNTEKPKSVLANKAKKNVVKKTNPTFVNNTSVINNPITNPITLQNETVVNDTNDLSGPETIAPKEVAEVEEKIEEPIKKPKPKTETLTSIEKSPVYPGCEKQRSELLKKKCLMSKIQKFVASKFNSDLTQDLGLDEGRKKINVSFIIDRFGNVNVLRVRGQHKVLEKEAIRVVNALPKMKPGRKNGKSEPVIYNLPIIYSVEY